MAPDDFWVDADGLERAARPYHQAAEGFDTLAGKLAEILGRHHDAFGDDDLGNKFKGPFDSGVESVKGSLMSAGGRITYVGDGLQSNADDFRTAEESAVEATDRLNSILPESPH